VAAVVDHLLTTDFSTRTSKEIIMKKTQVNSNALTLVLAAAVSLSGAIATFPAKAQDSVQDRLQERSQLRIQEREALRLLNQEQIQTRTRLQVNKLSDQAPMWRQGPSFGPDAGPGPFAGSGPVNNGGGFGGASAGGRGR